MLYLINLFSLAVFWQDERTSLTQDEYIPYLLFKKTRTRHISLLPNMTRLDTPRTHFERALVQEQGLEATST